MMLHSGRRAFLQLAGAGLLPARPEQSSRPENAKPSTPRVTLNVRDFGASGTGSVKETRAIQQALDRCSVLGGGEVLVPAGEYLTGALALRSETTLRLAKGATILGSPDFEDYPVMQVRWEGKWIEGRAGLIYALDARNIGISGPGRIVGNTALGGRPTPQNPLRHPALIEPIDCDGIRFEDFSATYHLMWSIHPTYCENVRIDNLTIRSTGGNGDGIDIDSCRHVRIDGCDISSGDDCIAIKSGRGSEAWALGRVTEDVQITNCTFADANYACIGIGSETSGGIRNVRIGRCSFKAAKTFAIYIKSRVGRGAFIEDISAEDLDVSGTNGGFLRIYVLDSGIEDQNPVPGLGGITAIRNFRFSGIRIKNCPVLVDARLIHPDKPLEGFALSNVTGNCAAGISLANAKKANLRDIHVTGYAGPLISIYNVSGAGLNGAGQIPAPELPEPFPVPATPYRLR